MANQKTIHNNLVELKNAVLSANWFQRFLIPTEFFKKLSAYTGSADNTLDVAQGFQVYNALSQANRFFLWLATFFLQPLRQFRSTDFTKKVESLSTPITLDNFTQQIQSSENQVENPAADANAVDGANRAADVQATTDTNAVEMVAEKPGDSQPQNGQNAESQGQSPQSNQARVGWDILAAPSEEGNPRSKSRRRLEEPAQSKSFFAADSGAAQQDKKPKPAPAPEDKRSFCLQQ